MVWVIMLGGSRGHVQLDALIAPTALAYFKVDSFEPTWYLTYSITLSPRCAQEPLLKARLHEVS